MQYSERENTEWKFHINNKGPTVKRECLSTQQWILKPSKEVQQGPNTETFEVNLCLKLKKL